MIQIVVWGVRDAKKPPVTMQFVLQPSCLQWRDAHSSITRPSEGLCEDRQRSPTVAHDRQDAACFSPSKKCIVLIRVGRKQESLVRNLTREAELKAYYSKTTMRTANLQGENVYLFRVRGRGKK
ncbi:hypothetical protein CDAR_295041 [Caerostris darwini]|uniref:Uncharacterized protein n=1 Tax=Caerostris darwini TaxID=1538125 RepID=A0AAV4UKQ0_9ARAC|nr:hypothetical protein CDAR_295041 [Caerostris darwini]